MPSTATSDADGVGSRRPNGPASQRRRRSRCGSTSWKRRRGARGAHPRQRDVSPRAPVPHAASAAGRVDLAVRRQRRRSRRWCRPRALAATSSGNVSSRAVIAAESLRDGSVGRDLSPSRQSSTWRSARFSSNSKRVPEPRTVILAPRVRGSQAGTDSFRESFSAVLVTRAVRRKAPRRSAAR